MGQFFFETEPWYEDNEQSVVFITLNGQGNRVQNHGSDTTYQIVNGFGEFEIDGEYLQVDAGDKVTIKSGSIYEDFGVMMQMVATSSPPFDPSTVEILAEPEREML